MKLKYFWSVVWGLFEVFIFFLLISYSYDQFNKLLIACVLLVWIQVKSVGTGIALFNTHFSVTLSQELKRIRVLLKQKISPEEDDEESEALRKIGENQTDGYI